MEEFKIEYIFFWKFELIFEENLKLNFQKISIEFQKSWIFLKMNEI